MKLKIALYFFTISLILGACFKEDEMIDPHQAGDLEMQTIGMGQYYETQAYFDLSSNRMVKSNSKDLFDLAFSCSDSSLIIRLNTAKFIRVAYAADTSFFTTIDTTGQTWFYDVASGHVDSIAMDGWLEILGNDTIYTQKVFIFDRGINALGISQGVRKVRISNYKNGIYTVEYANLNSSNYYKVEVEKDTNYNYVQLNLINGELPLSLEPEKNSWDLFFTQYTDILTTSIGEKYPYLVTGVLLNSNKVVTAIDTTFNFEEIKIENLPNFEFTNIQNTIGYNWKWYDFNGGFYTVKSELNYIIKDVEGFHYKLRFIGFYNDIGEKGYPKFEFQRL